MPMKTKDEVVNEFRDNLTMFSRDLAMCGVKAAEITKYAWEPWRVQNVRTAHKYLSQVVYPDFNRIIGVMYPYTPNAMFGLLLAAPRHPDAKTFKIESKSLVVLWNNRPMFPEDQGRWR